MINIFFWKRFLAQWCHCFCSEIPLVLNFQALPVRRKALNWLTAQLVYSLLFLKSFDYIKNGLFQRHSPHFTQEKPCIRFPPNKINVTFCSSSSAHTPDVGQANESGGPWQFKHKEVGNQVETDMLLTANGWPEQSRFVLGLLVLR